MTIEKMKINDQYLLYVINCIDPGKSRKEIELFQYIMLSLENERLDGSTQLDS